MCHNDELSCLFTTRFRTFYFICRKQPNPSQNFCYSHSLNLHVSGSPESVSKQPTQLIVELNSSLRLIIVTQLYSKLGCTLALYLIKCKHSLFDYYLFRRQLTYTRGSFWTTENIWPSMYMQPSATTNLTIMTCHKKFQLSTYNISPIRQQQST